MEGDLPVRVAPQVHAVSDRVEQGQEPLLDAIDIREVEGGPADRRRLLDLSARDGGIARVRIRPDEPVMAEDRPLRMLPEQEAKHRDVRKDRRDQDHGDVRRVEEPDWVPTTCPPRHPVGERQLNPCGFDVRNDEEDRHRPDQRDQGVRRLEHHALEASARDLARVDALEIVDGLWNRPGGDAGLSRLPVERAREDLLCNPRCDEQGDPGPDSPLRHDLVHQEHEVTPRE